MDDNYLWEIFTNNNKQNISEDHDHHHQLLQIPNFQQDQIPNQDPHHGSTIIQTSCDRLYKSSVVSRSASTSCDRLYKSSVSRSTLIITPHNIQISCDRLYESSGRTKKGTRSDESNKLKKVVHRNIERHRRQEMANLVTYLRSLIPFEFIKGKSSVSDQIQVAVNYIRHLQKNIQELDNKRKKIKNISLDNLGGENGSYNNGVTVNKCEDGMEILINVRRFSEPYVNTEYLMHRDAIFNSHKVEIFPLSKVLRWLLDQGLNVASCVNSKQDDWSLISIQCQVSDISSGLTADGLQKKLTDVIN